MTQHQGLVLVPTTMAETKIRQCWVFVTNSSPGSIFSVVLPTKSCQPPNDFSLKSHSQLRLLVLEYHML
jgi:hypothetical protein